MKSSKRKVSGFTLVEMIVVIAIIGILAAILVPSMMGYVTKARFSNANSTAKSLYNAGMVACREEDITKPIEEGTYSKDTAPDGDNAEQIRKYIYNYISAAERGQWAIRVKADVVTAACFAKEEGDVFVGTYPVPNFTKGGISDASGYDTFLDFAERDTSGS